VRDHAAQAKTGRARNAGAVTKDEITAVIHVHPSGRQVLVGDEEVLRRDYHSRWCWVSAVAPSWSGGTKMGDERAVGKKMIQNLLSDVKRSGKELNDPPALQPRLIEVSGAWLGEKRI
jgi:hypothetical protein